MKNLFSLFACVLIALVMVQYRVSNSDMGGKPPLKITVWDAFGYYMYLPATLIYDDYKQLKWLDTIDKRYAVTGGNGWQAERLEHSNYVFKYLGGVALMQIPFFVAGHLVAKQLNYPQDGFSPPYQYALGFGAMLYCLLGLLVLRRVLLYYFPDKVVGVTLLLVALATNMMQYTAIDNGQSHVYIFLLYALVLYATIRWHQRPSAGWALLIGYIIGLATMSRPTEAIMLFIPLLWNTHTTGDAKAKWAMVRAGGVSIAAAAIGGVLGILPQLLYWKSATGSFLYDVGSKWDFLNPHFRVLFGWEKGWFIYTPVTLLFIAGMFLMKGAPYRKSVLWFCLLNIYIIIAWHDWRYGGSYSTRALVQSYPVFALPLAALVEKVERSKWRVAFYALGLYLVGVNLFQLVQYNETILHYNDMNRRYYGRIYLNAHPSPVDMSVLDSAEVLKDVARHSATLVAGYDSSRRVSFPANGELVVGEAHLPAGYAWLKIEAVIKAPGHLWLSYLNATVSNAAEHINSRVRLFSPISVDSAANKYAFFMELPAQFRGGDLRVYLTSPGDFVGDVQQLRVKHLIK
ncbi:MAG: hypothetical protein V4649_17510 [Bacteroidota bacterium]